jgi:hypothetical protein
VGDRDLKIPKNKLIRFYEVVTIYWLTQINEIVLLGLWGLTIYYGWFGTVDLPYLIKLFNNLVLVMVAIIVNRAWARASLSKVRRATEDEISSVLDNPELRNDLGKRIAGICRDYAIPYEEPQD